MPYALLADLTVLVHLGFVVFVAVGGFLAWRHPVLLMAHVPSAAWALGIVAVGWSCPLTVVEKQLRLWAGGGGYSGAFMDRYVTGVLYPEQYAQVAQALVAAAVLASYAGLVSRRRTHRTVGIRPLVGDGRATLKRVNRLIDDVLRDPFTGIGKPEQLRHALAGAWSRRISEEALAGLRGRRRRSIP